MTVEVLPHDAIIDGDVRPLDDLAPEDLPEEPLELPLEQDDTPHHEQLRLRKEIAALVLELVNENKEAFKPRIRAKTKKRHQDKAAELLGKVDTQIVELLTYMGMSPVDSAAVTAMRKEILEHALAEQTAEIGRRAALAAGLEPDAKMRAAHDYDDD